jgi:hypothetical protein
MKYLSTLLLNLRPMQILMAILLSVTLFFTGANSILAARSHPTEGTVQLDKIEQKTQKAIDSPATSLESIQKRSEGGFNEIQGTADRGKMIRSDESPLPAIEDAQKALDKMQ